MPLPLPNVADETPRMMAEMLDLLPAQRKAASVEEMYAQFNERNKQKQVERRHRMDADLRCNLAETQHPREQDHHERGEPHRRIDSDDYSQCQAPRHTAGCHTAA